MLENIGTVEILLIVVLILLVLGPDKIPEIARSFAKFARWKASMEEEVRSAINPIMLDHDPPRPPRAPEYPPPPLAPPQPTPVDGDEATRIEDAGAVPGPGNEKPGDEDPAVDDTPQAPYTPDTLQ